MTKKIESLIARSYLWMGVGSMISRALSFVSTLILAGILVPDDFGVVSIATLISATLGLFRDFGLNQALIYQRDHIEEASDTALIVSAGISLIMYGIAVLLSNPAAVFFHNESIGYVVRVLPLTLVISSLYTIQISLMEKEMDFKRRILPEMLSYLTFFIVSITLAMCGFAFWSIIFGILAQELVTLVVVFFLSTWHPTFRFSRAILSELFSFGKFIMLNSLILFIYRNIDDFFIGRLLGTTPLGHYSLAYRIGSIPATNITHITGKVTYPTIMKMRDDHQSAVSFYFTVYRYLSLMILPLGIATIVLIGPFFHLFFGDKWNEAILLTQILAVFGIFRGMFSNISYLFILLGRIREMTVILSLQLACLVFLIYPVTIRYEAPGVCVLLVVLNVLVITVYIGRLSLFLPGLIQNHLRLAAFPLCASLLSFILPGYLFSLYVDEHSLVSLVSLVLCSGMLYLASIYIHDRTIIKEIKSFLFSFMEQP